MCITLGMPGSGHKDLAHALTACMTLQEPTRRLQAQIKGRSGRLPLHIDPYTMSREDGQDAAELAGATGTYLLVNRSELQCKWVAALKAIGKSALAGTPNRDFLTDQLEHAFQVADVDWRFCADAYTRPFKTLYNMHIPTRPIGGIFFCRAPDNTLVVSIEHDRLSAVLPILEYVLDMRVDRLCVLARMAEPKWYSPLLAELGEHTPAPHTA